MPPRQIHPALFTRKQIEIILGLAGLLAFPPYQLPSHSLSQNSGAVANKFAVQAAGSQLRG